jgi:hypothetical protein
MHWVEQDQNTGSRGAASIDKAKQYDAAKAETLPVIEREAGKGQVPFDPVRFTPVRSPGNYEAEFSVKEKDIIFHFWPYGYRAAEREGKTPPNFKPFFEQHLDRVMAEVFDGKRVRMGDYREKNGSFYVEAVGWGSSQFARDLSVQVCEKLYQALEPQ